MPLALPPHVAHLQSFSARSPTVLVAAFLVSSALAALVQLPEHSLLVAAVSWALLWTYSSVRVGLWTGWDNALRRRYSWVAGALLALAAVCEQTAHDHEGVWWTKALLPATLCALRSADVVARSSPFMTLEDLHQNPDASRYDVSNGMLAVLTVAGAGGLSVATILPHVLALSLCSALLTSIALLVLEHAITSIRDYKPSMSNGPSPIMPMRPRSNTVTRSDAWLVSLRDTASVVAPACLVLAFVFERSFRTDTIYYGVNSDAVGVWEHAGRLWALQLGLQGASTAAIKHLTLFSMIRQAGAFPAACSTVAALLVARSYAFPSFTSFWFALIYGGAGAVSLSKSATGNMMLARQFLTALSVVSFVILSISYLRQSISTFDALRDATPHDLGFAPADPLSPLALPSPDVHPIEQLVKGAEKNWEQLLSRQSQNLGDAVAEYRRRYGVPPPPNFDRWFDFAKRKGVRLIDDGYDSIYHSLLPFWALEPATVRSRVKEALGHGENALIGLLIRDGQATHVEGGQDWQREATLGMLKNFLAFLPDMDLAFNIHDEPRVVVPNDELSRLVERAKNARMSVAAASQPPKNQFSKRPKDMNNGKRVEEVKTTRFNRFAHQGTWTHSRLSCSPDSQARSIEENPKDNLTAYAAGDLGFVYNATAFSDICNAPSLSSTFGFFDRPNAFNLVQELFPIFSQSKISSYQDILYPSPWYWYGKVPYDSDRDLAWEDKADSLYWRGSTTGGFSRNGGWRRQHRQHVVSRLNEPGKALIMGQRDEEGGATVWGPKTVSRKDYAELMDVHFSHIGQCDPGDCDAQREFFKLAPAADQQDAWSHKHLLDMDGNAFSGRFYAFLQSKSMVYKMAVFREWHSDWLQPWLHYVPLSLRGDEWLETIRFFSSGDGTSEGKKMAKKMADEGRDWAGKALRNEDFEAWFFRLLLEYGRLIDDNRDTIGYPGP
ncbi:glycosyltransferase family 90 protein [Diplodia corticola]|uniref:Glycosyltransferase family 90 protein n=1 Tax=Diplodia corticola TaxID=236234 RepID=A0A1J9RUP4_9PEZI|nr:glycosyltransferase family 90 protein [Diplodia corticola]OJD36307.1 glycosyltransferase family 90 protein [Diplodia corticola]